MKTLAEEEWRPVVGWEGLYEVSSHGRVRSLDRRTRTRNPQKTRLHRGKVMQLDYKNNLNHGRVTLQDPSGARSKFIHRLVAEAFIGPQPEGKPFVLHWDDDPHNNTPGNLRWGTPMDNYNDAVRNGSKARDPSHCPRGHAYKGENLINNSAGGKRCRSCELSSDRLRHFEKLRKGLPTRDHRHGITGTGHTQDTGQGAGVTVARDQTANTKPLGLGKTGEKDVSQRTLISIDAGMSTGIVVGTYSDTQPYELTHAFQIEGGLEGFLKHVTYSFEWNGVKTVGVLRLPGYTPRPSDPELEFICEKFKPRGAGNNFAYKTNDLEPLRIEGAIRAMGIDPVWVQPAQQYFAGGESKSSTTNAHRWLKENGLHITGKDVGCKDANDARSALLHSISYLRRSKHKPTLEKYFPRG